MLRSVCGAHPRLCTQLLARDVHPHQKAIPNATSIRRLTGMRQAQCRRLRSLRVPPDSFHSRPVRRTAQLRAVDSRNEREWPSRHEPPHFQTQPRLRISQTATSLPGPRHPSARTESDKQNHVTRLEQNARLHQDSSTLQSEDRATTKATLLHPQTTRHSFERGPLLARQKTETRIRDPDIRASQTDVAP